jgi:hypothetical protein
MVEVFTKTPKGHDEITTKAGRLSLLVRWVLIFVDGKRAVEDLFDRLPSDDLQHTLGMLEEGGYIEPVSAVNEKSVAAVPDGPLPSITTFLSPATKGYPA